MFTRVSRPSLRLAAILCACIGAYAHAAAFDSASNSTVIVPLEQVRGDARAALWAVGLTRLGHEVSADEGVLMLPALKAKLREPNFAFPGFRGNVTITNAKPAAPPLDEIGLRGVFVFTDAMGRRAVDAYDIHYVPLPNPTTPALVAIREAILTPIYPAQPRVKIMLVPERAAPADHASISRTFEELYVFASSNAAATRSDTGRAIYYVMAFFLDRQAAGTQIEMRVAAHPTGPGGITDTTLYDFNGWRVAIFPVELDPNTDRVFAQAIVRPQLPPSHAVALVANLKSGEIQRAVRTTAPPPSAAKLVGAFPLTAAGR